MHRIACYPIITFVLPIRGQSWGGGTDIGIERGHESTNALSNAAHNVATPLSKDPTIFVTLPPTLHLLCTYSAPTHFVTILLTVVNCITHTKE